MERTRFGSRLGCFEVLKRNVTFTNGVNIERMQGQACMRRDER